MGTILPFKPMANRRDRAFPEASGKPTIIIFPGIHYERLDDADDGRSNRRRSRRQRKPSQNRQQS